ncbi:Uncharacterized protein DAT39_023552, partial [Clarias magur]
MQEPIKKVEALLLSFDQTERRRDRDTETEMITSVITEEDFPPLSRVPEPSSPVPTATRGRTPPLSPSPFPIALPRRIPRPRRRIIVQVSPPKNPSVAHPDEHSELLEIHSDQGTQQTSKDRTVPTERSQAQNVVPHTDKPREKVVPHVDTGEEVLPRVDMREEYFSPMVKIHAIQESSSSPDESDTELEPLINFQDDRGELDTLPLMDSPCPPTGVQ